MADAKIENMDKELIHKICELIEDGEKVLQQQEDSLNMFDVPWLYPGRLNQFNMQYKAWRKRFDELIEECENKSINVKTTDSAEKEQREIFIFCDDNDKYRAITSALQKHIAEAKDIIQDN